MSTQTLVLTQPTLSSTSESPESPERRRCWECLRRRLVCDSIRPVCNKCRVSGIVCPGYDDKKPLTWLAPGKVTCRTRRKSRTQPSNTGTTKTTTKKAVKRKDDPARNRKPELFGGVECILHVPLRTDVCDVYDAVQYYNSVFYPHTSSGHKTNQINVFVDQIPLGVVRYLPTAIAHNLVCVVFQHRVCVQTQWKIDCPSVKHAEARLHHHRGITIRALNEDIANEKTQSSDVVLTGVIMLLHSEIQSCISPNWRHHVNGLLAMLQCRGGALQWARDSPLLKGILLSFLICATFANTSSPPGDHVRIAPYDELIELAEDLYSLGLHPNLPCPMPLFLEIIRINNIRDEVSNKRLDKELAQSTAWDILKRIEAFEVETWDGYYEDHSNNEIIGLMFQSAVALFCISSLQSLSVLPSSNRLIVIKTVHSNRLYLLLEQSRKRPVIHKSVQWPLIIAGVEAGARVDKRQMVSELFLEQRTDYGTPMPLHAKSVLRTFWDGQHTDWDSCFVHPYAFVS